MEVKMAPLLTRFDLARFKDALLIFGAIAYFSGFLVVIEMALSNLSY